MTKPIAKDQAALRDMKNVIDGLKKRPVAAEIGKAPPAETADALERARRDSKTLDAMQPLTPSVTPGANQFGPGVLAREEKPTRPVEDVGDAGIAPATAYEHTLQQLDEVMPHSNIVLILPYLRKVDQAAEAAGISRDHVVADVKNRLAAWEAGTGVSLAGKLRDVYAHYGLPIDDAVNRKLNEVAAPGGAAAKEKLAKQFETTLQKLAEAGTDPKGTIPMMGDVGRMCSEALHLSRFSSTPDKARQMVIQTFSDTVVRVTKLHAEKNESDLKAHAKFNIWDRMNSKRLEGFMQEHYSILSPDARAAVNGVIMWLKDQKL